MTSERVTGTVRVTTKNDGFDLEFSAAEFQGEYDEFEPETVIFNRTDGTKCVKPIQRYANIADLKDRRETFLYAALCRWLDRADGWELIHHVGK